MKFLIAIFSLIIFCGCEENDVISCVSNVECSDDKEMLCDEPATTTFEDGTILEVRSCTYVTYEYCFEKTECRPQEESDA